MAKKASDSGVYRVTEVIGTSATSWEDAAKTGVAASQVLTGNDLKAVNGFDSPERVKPQLFDKPSTTNGRTRFEVPARSYTVIQWDA